MMSDELQALSLPGGDDGIRTHDPLLAGQVLSQLSYTPVKVVVSPFIVHHLSFTIYLNDKRGMMNDE